MQLESIHRERFYFAGIVLFILGLLSGLAGPALRNPRLGLSAHLEGVMNGMFLVLIGLIWDKVVLSGKSRAAVFGLLLWGAYANWLACILGGLSGASRMTPIAGVGFSAKAWQESLVSGLFISVGITMLVSAVMLGWGLLPSRRAA